MTQITENQAARYTVTCAGTVSTQQDPKGLEYLSIEDHVDMIGLCELTFAVRDGDAKWATMEIGADVEVKIGGSGDPVFVGIITGLRHAYTKGKNSLTVVAMDPLIKMAASREVMVFEEKKDSEAVSSVIDPAGCTAGVVDTTAKKHPYIFQRNESHFQFARRLAARNGFLLMANKGKIDFKKRQTSGGATNLPKSEVISLDYGYSNREIPKKVTSYGWDYAAKEVIVGQSKAPAKIGAGKLGTGGEIWRGDCAVSDVWVDSQDAANEMAQSALDHAARNFLRGRATVQGNGLLRAGQMIEFADHPTGFNPKGFVISSTHRIYVRGGFTTELRFASNTYPT